MGKLVPPWYSHQPLRWALLNLIQRGNSSQPEARSLHRQCQEHPIREEAIDSMFAWGLGGFELNLRARPKFPTCAFCNSQIVRFDGACSFPAWIGTLPIGSNT